MAFYLLGGENRVYGPAIGHLTFALAAAGHAGGRIGEMEAAPHMCAAFASQIGDKAPRITGDKTRPIARPPIIPTLRTWTPTTSSTRVSRVIRKYGP